MAQKQNLILIITFYRPFDSFVSKNEGMTESATPPPEPAQQPLHNGLGISIASNATGAAWLLRRSFAPKIGLRSCVHRVVNGCFNSA